MNINNVLSWNDRNRAANLLKKFDKVVIATPQKYITSPEDDLPGLTCHVIVQDDGAWLEMDQGTRIVSEEIPALTVQKWNKSTFSFLKHWLAKVYDQPEVNKSEKIIIKNYCNFTENEW